MLCNLSKHNTTYTIQIQTLSVKCSHKGTKKGNIAMKTFKTILGSAALLLVSKCVRKGRRSCRVTSSDSCPVRHG